MTAATLLRSLAWLGAMAVAASCARGADATREEYLTVLLAEVRTDEDSLELVVAEAELARRGLEDWVDWLDSRRGSGSTFLMGALDKGLHPVGFRPRRRAFDDLDRLGAWSLLADDPELRASLGEYYRLAESFESFGVEASRSVSLGLDELLPRGDWSQAFFGHDGHDGHNNYDTVHMLRAEGFLPHARDLLRMLSRREVLAHELLELNREVQLLVLAARGDRL